MPAPEDRSGDWNCRPKQNRHARARREHPRLSRATVVSRRSRSSWSRAAAPKAWILAPSARMTNRGVSRARLTAQTLDDHELDLAGAVLLAVPGGGLVFGRVVAGHRLLEAGE